MNAKPLLYNYRGKTVTNNGEQVGLVKHNTFESLLKGTGLENDPAFLAEIKPFFDYFYPKSQYTMEVFLEVLDRACDWLFPELSREEGREQIGRLCLQGFRKTIFGRVSLAAVSILGPDRLIMLSPRLFNEAVGEGERSIRQLGPHRYCYSLRHLSGTYEEVVGAFKAALEAAGAKQVRCQVHTLAPGSWDFFFEWD